MGGASSNFGGATAEEVGDLVIASATADQLKELSKRVAESLAEAHGVEPDGTDLLQMQIGIFRLLQGAAYRSYKVKFAANFHTHSTVKSLPYTLPNFVRFVKTTIELYKQLDIVDEACHPVLDALVRSCEQELEAVKGRTAEFRGADSLPSEEARAEHARVLKAREDSSDIKEDARELAQKALFAKLGKQGGMSLASVVKRKADNEEYKQDEADDARREQEATEAREGFREAAGYSEGFGEGDDAQYTATQEKRAPFLSAWNQVTMESADEVLDGCMSPVAFWYDDFMPKLLAAMSVGTKAEAEAELSGAAAADEADLDAWFAQTDGNNEFEPFGRDLKQGWPALQGDGKTKLALRRAWRLTRPYLNGVQKLREREAGGAGHRTSGQLTQYVAFLDCFVGRNFVEKAHMRLSFPYFIGNTTWRFMHTTAELACAKSEREQAIVSGFKDYFLSLATMYACPYCRGHLNQYVIRNKETWAYPIEYSLLGWNPGGDYATVTIQDKLSTLSDGPSLRRLLWKLHNAVNSSIARQESWYNTDEDALYTSRWWPNVDAEVEKSRRLGAGILSAATMGKIMGLLKIGVKLSELRDDMLERDEGELPKVLEEAGAYIERLDVRIGATGFLQKEYTFDALRPERAPVRPSAELEAFARSEDFTA